MMDEPSTHATATIDSPIGRICLAATSTGLTHVQFAGSKRVPAPVQEPPGAKAQGHLRAGIRALKEYFAGRREHFDDLVLAPSGTPFQLQVWKALRAIPFGGTATYGEVARKIRRPQAARAIGLANNRNPIAIVVPCHRVIGADGTLTGYGGGLTAKAWLLRHEGAPVNGV